MQNRTHTAGNRVLRVGLGVVLAVTVARVWLGPFGLSPTAQAQIPDSGLQRMQLLEEARRTNQLLSDIHRILHEGTLHVRLRGADNTGDETGTGSPAGSKP